MTELHIVYTILVLILIAALYTTHTANERLRRRVDDLDAEIDLLSRQVSATWAELGKSNEQETS